MTDAKLIEYLTWVTQTLERAVIARRIITDINKVKPYVQTLYNAFKPELIAVPVETATDRAIVENWLIRAVWPANKAAAGIMLQDFYYAEATNDKDRIPYAMSQLRHIGAMAYKSGYDNGCNDTNRRHLEGNRNKTPDEREKERTKLLEKTMSDLLNMSVKNKELEEKNKRLKMDLQSAAMEIARLREASKEIAEELA